MQGAARNLGNLLQGIVTHRKSYEVNLNNLISGYFGSIK